MSCSYTESGSFVAVGHLVTRPRVSIHGRQNLTVRVSCQGSLQNQLALSDVHNVQDTGISGTQQRQMLGTPPRAQCESTAGLTVSCPPVG